MKRKFTHYVINTVLIALASLFAFGFTNLIIHIFINGNYPIF